MKQAWAQGIHPMVEHAAHVMVSFDPRRQKDTIVYIIDPDGSVPLRVDAKEEGMLRQLKIIFLTFEEHPFHKTVFHNEKIMSKFRSFSDVIDHCVAVSSSLRDWIEGRQSDVTSGRQPLASASSASVLEVGLAHLLDSHFEGVTSLERQDLPPMKRHRGGRLNPVGQHSTGAPRSSDVGAGRRQSRGDGQSSNPKPKMPQLSWTHMGNVPQGVPVSITKHLDDFIASRPGQAKQDLILQYIMALPRDINNSQLLQAEVAYLFFKESQSPLFYDMEEDMWWVYREYWQPSSNNLNRVKAMFQGCLLPAMREVANLISYRGMPPPIQGKSDSCRMQFIHRTVAALETHETAENIIREAAAFMGKPAVFDENPDLFQLQNCVLDLRSCAFRVGMPSDRCKRASPITVPKKKKEE